jgi:hypothetical protein
MLRKRAVGCDAGQLPGAPRVARQPPRKGVEIIHARRHPWNAPLSYAAVWRAPERPPRLLSPCGTSITRPAPATISAVGSRGIRPRRLHSAASWPLSWWAVTSMPPDNVKGRPPVASQESGPDAASATITAASVTRSAVNGRRRGAARRREATTCRVSLLLPCVHRKMWHYLCCCPVCGSPHLGRARVLAGVTGTRRLPYGHWIVVVVARTYGRTDSGAAA